MLSYRYEKIPFRNDKDHLMIVMDNPDYNLVSVFLMSDIQSLDPSHAIEKLQSVLNGEKECEELDSRVCNVKIRATTSIIQDNLRLEDEPITINTKELLDIVLDWSKTIREFKEEENQ